MAIGIIVGILIAVFGIVAIAVAVSAMDSGNDGVSVIAGIVAIALVIAFILVPFSFHTVSSGEVAVVKHLGKIEEVKTAGTHFDLWLTNSYIKYDTKVQNLEAETAAYSSDAQTMNLQLTVQYQIESDKAVDIATQYGKLSVLESRIKSIALEKTKSVLSSHKAMDIIANRSAISPEVEIAIKDAVGEEYFVDIIAVVITNIDFSDAFELAVEEKMIAEQAKLKADYENERKIATARAEAEAKIIAAEAEAQANQIVNDSITDKLIKKSTIDAWDGKLPKVTGEGSYILPSDILS